MFGTNAISKLKETDPRMYLAVGVLSLLKAIALKNHTRRSRRELRDAGLFLGVGLVLYQRGDGSGDDPDSLDDAEELSLEDGDELELEETTENSTEP